MKNIKGFAIKFSAAAVAVAAVIAVALLLQASNISYAYIATNTVAASATVSSVCYLTSLSSTAINFGSIAAAANVPTANVITVTDNGGNAAATILVQGGVGAVVSTFSPSNSVWQGPGTNSIFIANTLYSASSQGTYTGTSVTNTLASTGITVPSPTQASPSQTASIYFGLNIPSGTAGGAYATNIILETSC